MGRGSIDGEERGLDGSQRCACSIEVDLCTMLIEREVGSDILMQELF